MEKFWEVPRLLWGESWERNREGVVCVLPSGGDAGEALGTASSDPSISDDQGRSSPRGRPCDSPDRRPLEGGARGESSRHFNFEEH